MISSEGVIAESNSPDARKSEELKNGETYYSRVVATAHNEVGLLRAAHGDFKTAAEQFARAAKWDSHLDGLNFNWGLAAFKAEQYKEATDPRERALGVHRGNVQS